MYNQVNQVASVLHEILLTKFILEKSLKISQHKYMCHDMKGDIFLIILHCLLLTKNQSDRRHVVDCVQLFFHQRFDHVANLESLEFCASNILQLAIVNVI